MERIREYLGFERWLLVGHSAGADHALAYTLTHTDRVRALACLSGGRVHNDREWHAAYSAARDAGDEADLAYAFEPNRDVNRQLSASWKAFCKRPELLRDLASLATPALFVYGADDIRPRWPSSRWLHSFRQPNGK
jgi:proline iminopeptidase